MTNSSFNLTDHEQDIDKIYLYSKNPYQAKYQLFINKGKGVGVKYNADQESKILIVFDDMIAELPSNKKLNSVLTDLFILFCCKNKILREILHTTLL